MKFLIIDDNPESVFVLERYIKKNIGNVSSVQHAYNGKEGIELAKKEYPDIILLDLVMPGMDGFKILNLLKSDPLTHNIPVIIVTSQLKDENSKLKAISIGADSFINFPVEEDELKNQIIKVIQRRNRFFRLNKYKRGLENANAEEDIKKELSEDARVYLNELQTNYSELIRISENLLKEVDENELLLNALRLSETKFRTLFENARDLIFLLRENNSDLIIADVNRTALKVLNLNKENLLGTSIFELYEKNSGAEKQLFGNLIAGDLKSAELIHKDNTGKPVYVEASAVKINVGDEDIVYLSERDITMQYKMLDTVKKLSRVVEESPISIVITNPEGIIEYVNKYFTELTGYSYEEARGKKPSILKSGYHNQSYYEELWQVITGGDVWLGEFKNKKKSGELYWESAIIFPITDREGVIINYVGLKQDVTVQKKLVEELRNAKNEAERANKLKSEFLAMISHEIRTPVNVMINYSNLLIEELMDNPDELVVLSREGIENAGKRLIRTIDLLLNYSMLETGNFELNKFQNDLGDIITEISKEFKSIADEKNIDLIVETLADDRTAYCDKYSVLQILANLVDNAIKFTEKGFVKLRMYKNGYNQKVISVEDTGIGIDENNIKNIFNPFWQAESGYSRKFEGLGLGLSVVKRYCDLNGIEIKVDSVKGKGSKFLLIFD